MARFSSPVKTVQKTILPLPAPKFVAQEEGAVPAKNRRKKTVREVAPSKATRRASELLATGEVYLPQGEELQQARRKAPQTAKPKTFQKTSQAAQILEEKPTLAFHTLKVGASKKTLQKHQKQPSVKRKHLFKIKRKHR